MEKAWTASGIIFTIQLTLFFTIPLLILVLKTKKDPVIFKHLSKFNGPISVPVVGTVHYSTLFGGLEGLFDMLCNRFVKDYGRLFRLYLLNIPYVLVASAENAEKILSSTTNIGKTANYDLLFPMLGSGLLTSNGERWRAHRKMLNPSFHFHILKKYLQIFSANAVTLSNNLEKAAANSKEFDVFEPVSLCALDIINESSMGTAVNVQQQEDLPYMKSCKKMHKYVMERCFSFKRFPLLYKLSGFKQKMDTEMEVFNKFTEAVIEKRKQDLKSLKTLEKTEEIESKREKVSFIDIVLMSEENGQQVMNDIDIRDEVSTFMGAGHDTVSAAISWTLFMMGTHKDIQERVYEELVQVFGDSDREPTMNDLTELKYLERCIKETMRLYPSVPFFERKIQEEIKLDCGRVIPSGCNVLFLVYALHRDPAYFPDPEKFDPDRFLPENCRSRHPYAYIPFSAGPRNCIGQKYAMLESKVVVSTILRRFRVEAAHTPKEAILEIRVTLEPKNGLKIKLFERNP